MVFIFECWPWDISPKGYNGRHSKRHPISPIGTYNSSLVFKSFTFTAPRLHSSDPSMIRRAAPALSACLNTLKVKAIQEWVAHFRNGKNVIEKWEGFVHISSKLPSWTSIVPWRMRALFFFFFFFKLFWCSSFLWENAPCGKNVLCFVVLF